MAAATDLRRMLRELQPVVVPGEFVVLSSADAAVPSTIDVLAMIVEDEGITTVVRRPDADAHDLRYEFVASWITLSVNSALESVGLTAEVSAALSRDGISCNVLAGHRHDHLLVPHDRVDDAVSALASLSAAAQEATNDPGSTSTRRGTLGCMNGSAGPVIVVPLDGSEVAERAVRPAVTLAAEFGGSITAVVAVSGDETGADDGQGDVERTGERVRDRLSRFDAIVSTSVEIVDAPPASAIAEVVASAGDSFVCMATHARGELSRLVVGSVAESVIRSVEVPVVLIGERCRIAPLVGERGRLVVCDDGSDAAAQVVPFAARLAGRQGLTTWLVEVVRPDENVPDDPDAEPRRHGLAAAATERLQDVAERFRSQAAAAAADAGRPAPDVEVEALHGADVGHTIEHFVDQVGASFVAVATHGAGGIARVALGSVAMEVVRRAPCPVVVVRAS